MDQSASFREEPKIAAWERKIISEGCIIRSITPLYLYYKPDGILLFALLSADIISPENKKLHPVLFIRGDACVIIPLIKNKNTGEEKFLMVQQRRIASGAICLEFPAGMLDENINAASDVALKELFEETGLNVTKNQLFPIIDRIVYSSPGGSDEGIYYFGLIISLSDEEYRSFEGRVAGKKTENEHITVTLKTKKEAEEQMTSIQGLLGLCLFYDYYINRYTQ